MVVNLKDVAQYVSVVVNLKDVAQYVSVVVNLKDVAQHVPATKLNAENMTLLIS